AEIHVFPRFRVFLYHLLFVQKLTVPHRHFRRPENPIAQTSQCYVFEKQRDR
ncbi:hypothetical protein NEIMUCOT_06639, partial [Neisseria mucosa ATCC 25996]